MEQSTIIGGKQVTFIMKAAMNNTDFSRKLILDHTWLVVGALTLVMFGFYGTQLSFSVFLKPMLEEFGWTRAMASGAMSTTAAIAGVLSVIMGRLTDKYGARRLVAISALLGGTGYLLMSRASSLWQLYLYFGVIVGICMAGCWTPVMTTISRSFAEKRVLALSITMCGITLGGMLLVPLSAFVITGYGWRHAYIVLAIIVLISAIPAVILLRRGSPQGTGLLSRGTTNADKVEDRLETLVQPRQWATTEAIKTVPFWMLMVTGSVIAAGYYFVAVHIVACATDAGIVSTSAALILTVMGGANIAGRLAVPSIAARIGSRFTLLLVLGVQAIALFSLMRVTGLWTFFALGSVFGFGFGAAAPIRTSMIPEFFGLKAVGTMIGVINISWQVGGICGPILAGYVFDLTGSYDTAFFAGGLLMVIGMGATCYLKAPVSSLKGRSND